MQAHDDVVWMRRALRQAARGWGRTSPNPAVGAVIVRDGIMLGAGWHHGAGLPHAEVEALRNCSENPAGATVYVTLEPCCTQGRTPPCTEALISAGIARVVLGCSDPNPSHAGKGVDILKSHGVATCCGVCERECRRLNEAFFWWITTHRPFLLLKMAMTLDGKIATHSGQSQWITGPRARSRVQRLRRWADAIMVGGDTVRTDDPSLTVRVPEDWPRQPLPCIWTSRKLPPGLKLTSPGRAVTPITAKPESAAEWREFLDELGDREITSLLLEGGGELAASALAAGIVNAVAFFVAPKILTGRDSRPVVGGRNPASLTEAMELDNLETIALGDDLLITGQVRNVHGLD